jgi:hypothetical protein
MIERAAHKRRKAGRVVFFIVYVSVCGVLVVAESVVEQYGMAVLKPGYASLRIRFGRMTCEQHPSARFY